MNLVECPEVKQMFTIAAVIIQTPTIRQDQSMNVFLNILIYRNYNYFHRNQASYGNKTNLLIVRNHHPVVFDSIFLSLKITKNASATQAVATQTWGQS